MADNENGFSVLDMAAAYAAEDGVDEGDLFSPVQTVPEKKDPEEPPKEKKGWMPDASLLEDMPEFQARPVTYDKSEFREDGEGTQFMANIADDEATDLARKSMDVMQRAQLNIEDAKRRHGIKYLKIPPEAGENPGEYHARMTAAASDDDYKRGQVEIDAILDEIKVNHPEYIVFENQDAPAPPESGDFRTDNQMIEVPFPQQPAEPTAAEPEVTQAQPTEGEDVTVIIDKRQAGDISFTDEELSKIRKSRTIELNIVEGGTIEFGEIEEIEGNVVDQVLEQYQSKVNSVEASLPASKYRCTFTGLSYPEVMDLGNSSTLNNLDGEWKIWSIIFNHIKNPSIGPFEEYDWYVDPETKKRVELRNGAKAPANIPESDVHHVSKFNDFLMKTSYKDQQFMLWKILCATAMEKEIVTVTCTSRNAKNERCNHVHDWVYAPTELIKMDEINEAVLEDMKTTAQATGAEIMKHYKTSPVAANNTVTLRNSGFILVYGHCSAYKYLTEVYSLTKVNEDDVETNPTLAADMLNNELLPGIKSIIIPQKNGKKGRVSKVEDIMKIIHSLDEVDWQSIGEVVSMILDPYDIPFALDTQCPKCKSKATIPVRDVSRLLFIVARSLSNVQVELKQT